MKIALTMVALNDAQVKKADIKNACLIVPVLEKAWNTLGTKFGVYYGKKYIVVRALYRLKSVGEAFRNHLADWITIYGTNHNLDPKTGMIIIYISYYM